MALAYARREGLTPALLAAVRSFCEDGLQRTRSWQANTVKRKSALLLLLDTEKTRRSSCWSERFRTSLAGMHAEERRAWERFVVHLNAADVSRPTQANLRPFQWLFDQLQAERVGYRLRDWWPEVGPPQRLEPAGSQLLKHFVWLAERLPAADTDELLDLLSRVQWHKSARADKVGVALAYALEKLPPERAWRPLQRVIAVFGSLDGQVWETAKRYAAQHGLPLPPVRPEHGEWPRWQAAVLG